MAVLTVVMDKTGLSVHGVKIDSTTKIIILIAQKSVGLKRNKMGSESKALTL